MLDTSRRFLPPLRRPSVYRLPALVALLASALLSGCVVHARAGAPAPEVVVFGPPVVRVGPVAHWHGPNCGHQARWYGGRWVYFVDNRWEYVEGGRVYVYRAVESRPAAVYAPRPHPGRGHAWGHHRHDGRDDDEDEDEQEAPRRYAPSNGPEPVRPEPVRPVPQSR